VLLSSKSARQAMEDTTSIRLTKAAFSVNPLAETGDQSVVAGALQRVGTCAHLVFIAGQRRIARWQRCRRFKRQ
jgi:hypothetical protein